MEDTYIIDDINNLAISIRKNAVMTLDEKSTDDLNEFISLPQVEAIILNHTVLDEDDNLLMTENQYETIFSEVVDWIINIGLAKLAGEDKINCAWDDETNTMVFWNK